jgi:hypothetical protein
MTVQSSFLIRCLLNSSGDPASGKPYCIQHVQTGTEFRAATLAEATQWMADQNRGYLATASSQEAPQ